MFNKRIGLVMVLLLTSWALKAQAVEPLDLIEKSITAHGGKEAITKVNARTLAGKFTVIVDEVKLTIDATQYFHYPNRYRAELEIAIGDDTQKLVQVINDDKGWQRAGESAKAEVPVAAIKYLQTQMKIDAMSMLLPLLDKERFSFSSIGEHEVHDKKAIGVNIKDKKEPELFLNLYFDAETNLIVKQEFGNTHFATGAKLLQETYLSGYQKFNDVMMPTKVESHFERKLFFTADYNSVQLHEQLDASLFEKLD